MCLTMVFALILALILVAAETNAENNRDWRQHRDCQGFGYIYYSPDDTPGTRQQVEEHNRRVEDLCGGRARMARPHRIID